MAQRKRRPRFNFDRADVPRNAVLEPSFRKDRKPVKVFFLCEGEEVKVDDAEHVLCDGYRIGFSELTTFLLEKLGRKQSTGDQPSRFWRYDGEKLDRRYERICILREARQGG